jgi:hypothetical protein
LLARERHLTFEERHISSIMLVFETRRGLAAHVVAELHQQCARTPYGL